MEEGAGAPVRNQQAREQMVGTRWKSISVPGQLSKSMVQGIVTSAVAVCIQARTAQEILHGGGGVF